MVDLHQFCLYTKADCVIAIFRGKFGEVKRCRNQTTGIEFAAKFIATPTVQDREEVRHELEITKRLKHRRLLQVYDAFSIGTNMCLVLEV